MAGRKQKHFQTSWRETIPGLAHDVDGRWRIIAGYKNAGKKWSDADERRAVTKAKQLLGIDKPQTTGIEFQLGDAVKGLPETIEELTDDHADALTKLFDSVAHLDAQDGEADTVSAAPLKINIPDSILYPWMYEQMTGQESHAFFRKIGLPHLADHVGENAPRPGRSTSLANVWAWYESDCPSKSKPATKRQWDRFAKFVAVTSLSELTKDRIHDYRNSIEADKSLKSAQTKTWMYGQIKSVMSFALKSPTINAVEVRACLDRLKLLWTAQAAPAANPRPISREDFHKLLGKANGWRAWLLLGLNAAMYLEELCALTWADIDLDKGTLSMLRGKTKIARAATLWPETIAALRALPRTGSPFVFVSPHGTRYASSRARANAFADLRTRAGVSDDISFSMLRDAAFTAAAAGTTDSRLAKILAGHSSGMEDKYILRNPGIVKPASDAVYGAYGPF